MKVRFARFEHELGAKSNVVLKKICLFRFSVVWVYVFGMKK